MGLFEQGELDDLRADFGALVLTTTCVLQSNPHADSDTRTTVFDESASLVCSSPVADRRAPTQLDSSGAPVPQIYSIHLPNVAVVLAANNGRIPRSADQLTMHSGRVFTILSYTYRDTDDVLGELRCKEVFE